MQFNTLTLTLQNFITALSGAYGRIQGSASTLLGLLIGIEVVLLGLWTALGGGDNVVGIFKRILHIGAWVWIVQSYPMLSKALVESLVKAGLLAGGGSGDVSLLMDPSRLAGYGLDATAPLTQKLADLGMTDLSDLIVFGFGYLAIMACFLIMAINVFLAVLEYYVFAALAGIFLPFGLLEPTKFLAEKANRTAPPSWPSTTPALESARLPPARRRTRIAVPSASSITRPAGRGSSSSRPLPGQKTARPPRCPPAPLRWSRRRPARRRPRRRPSTRTCRSTRTPFWAARGASRPRTTCRSPCSTRAAPTRSRPAPSFRSCSSRPSTATCPARSSRRCASTSTTPSRAITCSSRRAVASSPSTTRWWRGGRSVRAVAAGTQTSGAFLARVGAHLEQLVAEGRALGRIAVPPPVLAPAPARGRSLRKPHGAGARTPNPGRQRRP